jgi:hypothetical protein
MAYGVIANYGNDSIALLQWLHEHGVMQVTVLSVDTQWAAPHWAQRLRAGRALAKQYGFETVHLQSSLSFEQMVLKRHNFPSVQYHWCAAFLKGIPLLDWLDCHDPGHQMSLVFPKRRAESKALAHLPVWFEDNDIYHRRVWHPLCDLSLPARDALIVRSRMPYLQQRSLECDPCIYSSRTDFRLMHEETRQRLARLEARLGKSMFAIAAAHGDQNSVKWQRLIACGADADLAAGERSVYYQGCGSQFGCGY